VRIWVHAVFSIKKREFQTLDKAGKDALIAHIKQQCYLKKIYLDSINGCYDHLHLLISLGSQQKIADVMHDIKGEASFWANKQKLFTHNLEWQDDYFAVSVSESQVEKVRKYIDRQEEHHRHKMFAEEVNEFLEKYGWIKITEKVEGVQKAPPPFFLGRGGDILGSPCSVTFLHVSVGIISKLWAEHFP
jgi:putative transposase